MKPDRVLAGNFFGTLDGKEVNVVLAAIEINGRSTWMVNGSAALIIEGIGVAAANVFLDAIGGLAVELEPAVKDSFEGLYTVPSQSHAPQSIE